MLKPKESLYFYRILNWENKISGIRPVGYVFFGYFLAGFINIPAMIINALAALGALMLCYSLNDYYDFLKRKERNFLGSKIEQGNLKTRKALLYCLIPIFLIIPLLFAFSKGIIHANPALAIIIFGLGLIIFYSFPPFKLKERKIWGFLAPPLATSLLFLEGFSILEGINTDIILLTCLLFLFQCYLETLHILEDSLVKEEVKKIEKKRALGWLTKIPLISLLLSLSFIFYNRVFLVTSFFSVIRLIALKKFQMEDIKRIRRNIFLPQWSLYEFGIYGILGLLNYF